MSDTGVEARSRSGTAARTSRSGPLWWPRRRSVVLDGALTVFSVLECLAQGMIFANRTNLPITLVLPLAVLAGSVLMLRRQWPVAVVLVAVAVLPIGMGGTLIVVGLYTLTTTDAPRRLVGTLSAMVMVGTTIVLLQSFAGDHGGREMATWFLTLVAVLFSVVNVVPPVLLGMYVRARRRLVESLRDRADGLERELSLLAERAEERAEWARREERTRIARDMHDVVAHRVSLMVVHAAALQAIAQKDPEKAASNAALVGDMGRQALTELRTMLGVLRSGDDVPAGGDRADPATRLVEIADSAGATGQAPAGGSGPDLADLPALVQQSRETGMTVEFSEESGPDGAAEPAGGTADADPESRTGTAEAEAPGRGFAPVVERTAYRVVQEALTNVHKHAPGAATRVRVARRADEVAIQVHNGAPPDAGPHRAALPSGGNGLLGMRERVTALGGTFVSGPTDEGGFRVSALIPDGTADGGDPDGAAAPRRAPGPDGAAPAAPGVTRGASPAAPDHAAPAAPAEGAEDADLRRKPAPESVPEPAPESLPEQVPEPARSGAPEASGPTAPSGPASPNGPMAVPIAGLPRPERVAAGVETSGQAVPAADGSGAEERP